MGRYIEMQHASAVMSQHEEYEQDSKTDSRNYEEIDGYHCLDVIFKKGAPSLRRWLAAADHIFGDSCLRHIDAEFLQFPVDSRRAPSCVSGTHLPDQISNLLGSIGSSRAVPVTLPRPIEPKSLPMPCKHGFRFDEQAGISPVRPQTAEPYPKQPVRFSQARTLLGRTL